MTEAKGNRMLMAPLLAGLLGAGLALLFAPRSGKETRARMRMKADKAKLQAEDNLSHVRESLNQGIQDAQDLRRRLSEALANTGEKAKQETDELRKDERDETRSSVLSTWEEEV
jgi:gas vesicle protein